MRVSRRSHSGRRAAQAPPSQAVTGGEFQIGNTGTIKRHDFKQTDACFAKNLLLEGTNFWLAANKDADFVILGAFLQPAAKSMATVKTRKAWSTRPTPPWPARVL
jgi:hypothetical protein